LSRAAMATCACRSLCFTPTTSVAPAHINHLKTSASSLAPPVLERNKASLHICPRVPHTLVHHLLSLSQSSRSLAS
jgi:hypothetical protein